MAAETKRSTPQSGDFHERVHLVKVARKLEADLARRRKLLTKLRALDDDIRSARKLVRDLTTPLSTEAYRPLDDEPIGAA